MKVLILYNEPVLPKDHPDAESEHEVLYTANVVAETLQKEGHEVGRLGVARDPTVLIDGVRTAAPDVVFNLFEGLADDNATETYAVGLLEWLGVPFTGCPTETLCVARNKPLTKKVLRGAGLPTADFFVVERGSVVECPLTWPVIVKPALQDASVGIHQASVVTTLDQLNTQVARLLSAYGPPVLVEEFIEGREFSVPVIDAPRFRVLPPAETLFTSDRADHWGIFSYDAKWNVESYDFEVAPGEYPAEVGPDLGALLTRLGGEAFRLLGCRGYARVDVRVRPGGEPFILEVNPNADLSPEAGLASSLAAADIGYEEFLTGLITTAAARGAVGAQHRRDLAC